MARERTSAQSRPLPEAGERVPPQSLEAEMAVLGAILLQEEALGKAIELLDEQAFYRLAHRKIFSAALALHQRNEPVDIVTLSNELAKRKELDEVGGSYYLTELVERVPSAANVEYHARIVLEKALRRRLIEVANEISTQAYEGEEQAYELIDQAEQKIFRLAERRLRRGFESIDRIMHETFDVVEQFHRRHGGVTGVPTGFTRLDELTAGLQNSELIIIAGRPSMGKTAFALNIAHHAAINAGVTVGIFSLEMARHQLALRMLCTAARVDQHLVRTGRLADEDWPRLSLAVGHLAEAPIFIDDTPAISVLEIRAKARRLKAQYNLGLLIIDYLQLVRGPSQAENRQQEISMITQSLKALAKELNIPVVALSQLSRAVETRAGDRRPILSDLRESGAIEQDADVVLFLYRPEVYRAPEQEGTAEVIIGKQRSGPTGTVNLTFVKEYVMFANPAAEVGLVPPEEVF
ncbi:MAG: replicative DNA helicase [candidate division KSB1 bacterium]|nr:replicative DNA helicase [candidate division KSB1 bacterium]MDZ7294167.1 replicative DNA helicase [candidate division KSB1 bacterium]MDZ7377784.1 replicative DNA helicase [candidate division KSB1 bacterium]MDZ7384996.1 replicative DNA helicase [candidate division KSB1 bacterium]MDZ7391671.1 replicative DNA helicase [candidate division KSB1 bacterium]